jgi:hypothetical protein
MFTTAPPTVLATSGDALPGALPLRPWQGGAGLLTLLLLVLTLVPCRWALAADHDPVVIVNRDVPGDNIGANALRAIFGMRLRAWPNGDSVRVLVLKDDSPTHASFSKQLLSIFPHQLRRAWDRLVYSGTGQAPRTVDSEAAMVQEVAATPGAIGYVSRDMVNDDVRVVGIR